MEHWPWTPPKHNQAEEALATVTLALTVEPAVAAELDLGVAGIGRIDTTDKWQLVGTTKPAAANDGAQ